MNRFFYILFGALLIAILACVMPHEGFCFPDSALGKTSISLQASENEQEQPNEPASSFLKKVKSAAAAFLAKIGIKNAFAQRNALLIICTPFVLIAILIIMLWRPNTYKKSSGKIRGPIQIGPQKKNRSRTVDIKTDVPKTDKDRVLMFFFQLFKQQVGAPPDAPTKLILIESRPTCPNDTYEMRVKIGSDWAFRRMSIGLLGQGGGSRSKCFYVIYDSHMVLKIPSKGITEFSIYRERIKAEAKIVERLYPRECIVPRIAVILKAIHTIPGSEKLAEDVQENKYVHLLEVKTEFQDYLKIGSSFIFFMDLSKHFFLSSTLEEIHRGDQRIVTEAMKQHELLWDRHGFVCRYGEDAGIICHDLQDAYYRCEGRLLELVKESNIDEEISTFQLKQWFLTHLAGEKVDADAEEINEELIDRINRLMYKVIRDNHKPVKQYRHRVQQYIREMRFSQHRTQLENLSSNTLDLLAGIEEAGIAMRDLKPENLFVAGPPEAYPYFLNDPQKFSIGLIDVETAVVMDAAKKSKDIPQPQLAGTPLYATPTHLLPNPVLEEVYGDVRNLLHMQDWYATTAIIFKSITGKNLFSASARTFPQMLKQIKLMDPAGPDLEKDVARINLLFWNSAMAEFKYMIAKDLDIFERMEVAIPKSMIPDIIIALHSGCKYLTAALSKTISGQKVFSGKQKHQFLLDASVEKIKAMKKKLKTEASGNIQRNRQRQKALVIMERIEKQKLSLQRKLEAAAALKAQMKYIASDQLLEAMFEKVFTTMYLPQWPAVKPAQWDGETDKKLDITTYQATLD